MNRKQVVAVLRGLGMCATMVADQVEGGAELAEVALLLSTAARRLPKVAPEVRRKISSVLLLIGAASELG